MDLIHEANSAPAVMDILEAEQHNPGMSLAHVSAAWAKLAQDCSNAIYSHQFLMSFYSWTISLLDESSADPAAVGIFWAAAWVEQNFSPFSPPRNLWGTLSRAVMKTVDRLDARAVATVFAGIVPVPPENCLSIAASGLVPMLAKRVPDVISEMGSEEVLMVITSISAIRKNPVKATMRPAVQWLLPDMMVQARVVLPFARPLWVAGMCLCLEQSDYYSAPFFSAVAAKVINEAASWEPGVLAQVLPKIVWAFARLKATGMGDRVGQHVYRQTLSSFSKRPKGSV